MPPDNFQQAWQAHSSQTRVTVDADLLRKEVQRNQRDFRATILRRDVIEVGVGLLLLPYWIYQGLTSSLPWSWWLTVPAIIWVVGFFLVDRMRHPQTPSDPGEPLLKCVKNSLAQVDHQIWLLRNIFWWYLLPFTLSILSFFAHVAWLRSKDWSDALGHGGNFVFLFALYGFIYWLNQRAVRSDLEPRRQELLTLLASLGEESTDEPASATSTKCASGPGKLWRFLIGSALCVLAIVLPALIDGITDSGYDGPPQSSGPAGDSLASLVADLRKEKSLVGLAAMVMVDGQVEAAAAHGERKKGSGVPLEISDRWHLGGITKSITATMIARLVESGQMQWSDTIGEIFPEAAVHEEWKPVTLRQLLTDTAGAPANFSKEVSRNRPPLGPESTQARREAVLNVIADKPAYPPGEKYLYSNVGYTIAGAMAEKATGANWEELVKQEVFDPLELAEAGFGPPKSGDDTLEQPRGHRARLAGKVPVDDNADNTSIMGPAGIVHMSLRDLCTYAREHLRGDLGEGQLLSAETYKLLHAREFGPYSCGWIRRMEPGKERPYAVYWHNGSNTMWYALVVFIPEKNMVVAVTSNDGDSEQAEAAAWEIVKASAKQVNVGVDRSGLEQQQGMRLAVPIDDAEAPLTDMITDLRREKKLVGLAAMVVVDGQVVASAVDGERKKGSGVQLEIGDRWHLGSITKSITATMIARLIESGQIEWSDSIGECFPDAPIHDDWKLVTLRQLLTHTAGAPPNFSLQVRLKQPALGPECTLARRDAVLDVLAEKPAHPPGEKRAYSNVGYTIAGAMAEKATGATWEDLVTREVFEPLELTGAGFGPPKSPDETLAQPRGHRPLLGSKVAMGDDADNTPIMGPAGTVHMTLSDLCTYATDHLRGDLGAGKLLSAETYKLLHTPELDQYACGWVRIEPNAGIPYAVYWHNGSNTMWYALVVFIPETNMVVAVTSNDGDVEQAEAAAWAVVWANVAASELPQTAEYAKKSPFAAVRWQQLQPEVKIGNEWFKLVSLSELPASEIVAFSRQTYGKKWQKRFEEDLVELLTRMGHAPGDTVKLIVQSLTSPETRTLEDVPMTEANRRAIYRANLESPPSRERDEQQPATRPAVPIDDAALFRARIDEFLNAARTKAGFSGAVLVARGGQPVYEGAFGFSHLESKAPNTLDTPFRIASLSKQFTAAAIFRLESQGRLSIDDPVHQYLPEFAESPYRDITIHHLLTHTSGLPRSPEGILGSLRWNAMSKAATPVDNYVRLAVQMPLGFKSGADYEYSNFGYRVLAALIARVTGRDYADFMEQEIFQPLGMKDTGVARVTRPPSEAHIAEGLSFLRLDRAGEPHFANGEEGRNFDTGCGSGGIYSTANDLLRWDRVLAGDEFLSESQKSRLFRPVHDNYACGWVVKKSGLDGRLYQMHNGANDGFFSQMMRVPEDDLVIIAVGNVQATPAIDDVIEQLFRLCRSLPYRDP